MYSQPGPPVELGEIYSYDRVDLFVGGSKGCNSSIYFQSASATFEKMELDDSKEYEDVDAILFDKDGDGDQDLYIVSGGAAHSAGSEYFQNRLFLNEGGVLIQDENSIPKMTAKGSVVTGSDFDNDGDLDLFVGGSVKPGEYPTADKSFLLINNDGKFDQAPISVFKAIDKLGVITDAQWDDFDQDGDSDLIVLSEWAPIRFFKNESGELIELTVNEQISSASG